MSDRQRADLAMVLVSLLWGITFPLIRSALVDLDPYQFVGWRFSLATLAFLPLVLLHPTARARLRPAVLPGLLLGALAWASYMSQTIGLQTVPAGRAAFITGTSVILVPMLSPLFRAGRPGKKDFLAAFVATVGLYFLTMGEGSATETRWSLSRGDLWILVCALAYAVYIHVLQKVLTRGPHEISLAFTQVAGIGLLAATLLGARGNVVIPLTTDVLVALSVCAVLATVGTFWLQTRYQGRSTAERVALIFSLEPVFATLFAYWILGETLGTAGAFGAGLILAAVVGVEWVGLRQRRRPPDVAPPA